MFPAILMSMMAEPARLKTELSFKADDPWNHNQRAQFVLDRYLAAQKGAQLKPHARAFNGSCFCGIRSEIDGVDRLLPESLAHFVARWKDPASSADPAAEGDAAQVEKNRPPTAVFHKNAHVPDVSLRAPADPIRDDESGGSDPRRRWTDRANVWRGDGGLRWRRVLCGAHAATSAQAHADGVVPGAG